MRKVIKLIKNAKRIQEKKKVEKIVLKVPEKRKFQSHSVFSLMKKAGRSAVSLEKKRPIAPPERVVEGFGEGLQIAIKPEYRPVVREIILREPEREVPEKEVKKPKLGGIPLETVAEERIEHVGLAKEVDLRDVNRWFPLIRRGRKVYAWANIRWNARKGSLIYYVIEPPLSEKDKKDLSELKRLLEERLDIDFEALRKEEAFGFLEVKIEQIIDELGLGIDPKRLEVLKYYIYRDFIGLNEIEPLMHDTNIEDISCDGVGLPLYIVHRVSEFGEIPTNIVFEDANKLDSFVIKLAQRAGRSISIADPLLDGALPDGSRVQATYGTEISRKGSNFTIRKFTSKPLSPIDIVNFGTLDTAILAYLWFVIEHRRSILIAGPVATGKTTLLNSLCMFIRPGLKVITIEDTPELRLYHENWIPQVAREGYGPPELGGRRYGEINMHDLLKSSLRQRPDYLIVGEVRGVEASVMFQGMSTGHPGISTLHADALEKIIDRLTTPPINLPESLLENLDIIIFLVRTRTEEGEYVRKIKEIMEVEGYDEETERIVTRTVYHWSPSEDKYEPVEESIVLERIAQERGIDKENVLNELRQRIQILNWMKERSVTDYRKFTQAVAEYYISPKSVLEKIRYA